MSVLTAIYVVLGGYMATAINDFIQGLIMLVGIVAVIVAVLLSKGGLTEAIAQLSEQTYKNASGSFLNGAYTSFFGPQLLNLIGVVILLILPRSVTAAICL